MRFLRSTRDRFLRWTSSTTAEWHAFRSFPDDVQFRLFTAADEEGCIALYRLLESGFPRDDMEAFITCLQRPDPSIILAERGGNVVGMGGISLSGKGTATLYYGLVDPGHQGCGIGTALALLRLCALPAEGLSVFIWTLQQPQSFYRRLGFLPCFEWEDAEGTKHPGAVLDLTGFRPKFVQRVLRERNVMLEGDLELAPCSQPVINRIHLPDGTCEFHFPGLEERLD